jgi:hypothetical protein
MLTKVVVALLVVVAVGFAGTSLYENGSIFSHHSGQCHRDACTGDSSYQPATQAAATCESTCCDSMADETAGCCSTGSKCCQNLMALGASKAPAKSDKATDDDGIDPWE